MKRSVYNILVLTYWSYKDALVQTYTLPYLKIISKYVPENSRIYLFTLEQTHLAITKKEKMVIEEELKAYGIYLLPFVYHKFGLKAIVSWLFQIPYLFIFCKIKSISHIHSWCTPAGAIGYILSNLTRKPLILDSFEPHAEPMVEAGQWKKGSIAFRILFTLEKLQSRKAKIVIACVEKMKEYAREKYDVQLNDFYHKPACVNFELFTPQKTKNETLLQQLGISDKIVCVYAGKFGGSYLKQEVFDLFKVAFDFWKGDFRVILLTNHPDDEIKRWRENSELPEKVVIKRFVPHLQVPEYLGLGDFGIVPFVPVPSKRFGSPIKTGEYMAMGLPIVITNNISDDSMVIENSGIGAILKQLNKEEYQKAILKIDFLIKEDRKVTQQKIREIAYREKQFRLADNVYKQVYGRYDLTQSI